MLNRIKLYFTNKNIPDARFIQVLQEHGLNPYQEYDKKKHIIPMYESVLQIYKELAQKDPSYANAIESFEHNIAILKDKENEQKVYI